MGYQYYYDYNFPSIEPEFGNAVGSVFGTAFGFMLVFYLLAMVVSAVFYILQSLGMYTIAKRRGINNPWLAWLPLGNMWILGSISDQYQYVAKGRVRNRRKVLLGLMIALCAVLVLIFIGAVGVGVAIAGDVETVAGVSIAVVVLSYIALIVVGIVATVFQYMSMYDLYSSCDPSNAVLYLVLSIFFNVCLPIFFFICRNKDGGMPPRKQAEQPQPVIESACESVVTEEAEGPQQPEAPQESEVPAMPEEPEVTEEIKPQEDQE